MGSNLPRSMPRMEDHAQPRIKPIAAMGKLLSQVPLQALQGYSFGPGYQLCVVFGSWLLIQCVTVSCFIPTQALFPHGAVCA